MKQKKESKVELEEPIVELEEPIIDKITKKKMLTLFMLSFPIIIITALPSDNWTLIVIKILLTAYTIVIIKNFIDEFYGE